MDWVDFTITAGFSALFLAVKNSKTRERFKAAFLKLYRQTKVFFPAETSVIDKAIDNEGV